MQYNTAVDLRQERSKLVDDNRALLVRAAENNRDLTEEENIEWDKRDADIDGLKVRIDRAEKQERLDDELRSTRQPDTAYTDAPAADKRSNKERYTDAFTDYILHGETRMKSENREVLYESRDQTVGTTTEGGFTVPEEWEKQVVMDMAAWGGMRQVSTVKKSATGVKWHIPTATDIANTGELVLEAGSVDTEADIVFAEIQLDAYKYSSKLIQVSRELLQDSAADVQGLIRDAFSRRLGTITNLHFTTGDGTGKPNGVVTAASSGKTTASATTFTYSELIELKHSVDPAYRTNARFMFNDSTLSLAKRLLDADNRPLWQAGFGVGEPDRIDGDPFTINQDVASVASTTKAVYYGDFSKYWIRDTGGLIFRRLDELYAANDLVGFVALMRTDGDLLDAGTDPVKFMTQAT